MVKSKHKQFSEQFKKLGIETRPNAEDGVYLLFILPLCLIVSTLSNPIISSPTYKFSAIISIGFVCTSLAFLYFVPKDGERLSFTSGLLWGGFTVTFLLFRLFFNSGYFISLWGGLISTVIYHEVYYFALRTFKKCFTLGEAAICCQALILLLFFTSLNFFMPPVKELSVMEKSTVVLQFGIVGVLITALSSYLFDLSNPKKFYWTNGALIVLIVFLVPSYLLQEFPLNFLAKLILKELTKTKILLFWITCSVLAILAVSNQIKSTQKASTATRKVFHILAVIVIIPGLLYSCSLLYLATGVILGIFCALEILRILEIPPLGQYLQKGLKSFGDEKDAGVIAFTPLYLLAGCALPLWIHPSPCDVTNSAMFNLLPLLSGVLTIGIGDSAASIIGSKFGTHYWNGSNKTKEGTAACIISQFLIILLLVYLGFLRLNVFNTLKVIIAVVVSSKIEAQTDQIDNLVLPLIMYVILVIQL